MYTQTLRIGLAAAILLCGCALQEDIYTLDSRLSSLERRNLALEKRNRELEERNQDLLQAKETISSRVEGLDKTRRDDEMQLREQYAAVAAQLQILREESQSHAGRLEEMEYLLGQKLTGFENEQLKNRERLDKLAIDVAAIQKRVNGTGPYLKPEASQKQAPAGSVTKTGTAGEPMSDNTLYLQSKKAFDAGDMAAARQGFKKLLDDFPTSSHADNSQFWIGESYFREKWYEKAILEYQKVIENYPKGNKIPAALLKQGLSFLNIGETNNARLILKDLVAKHPNTNEARTAKKTLESL